MTTILSWLSSDWPLILILGVVLFLGWLWISPKQMRHELDEINRRNGTHITLWQYFWHYRAVRRHDRMRDLTYWVDTWL